MAKVRRKDVLEYAEHISDPGLYHCGTCMHYGKAIICGECYGFCGSRYRFDWRGYYEEHREDIEMYRETQEEAYQAGELEDMLYACNIGEWG